MYPGLDVRKTLVYAEYIETLMVMRRHVSRQTLDLTMLVPWAAKPGRIKMVPRQPTNPFSSRGCANVGDAADFQEIRLLVRPNRLNLLTLPL